LEELQREGIQPQATQGTPADLGTAVETALYEAYGKVWVAEVVNLYMMYQ
jgi:hypothetical protein